MIKVLAPALRHPENRSLADFHHYWGESHGPLFANTSELRGYIQHLTLPDAYDGQPAPTFDGVSMFLYDDVHTMGVETYDPRVLERLEGISGVPHVAPDPRPPETDAQQAELLRAVLDDDAQLFDRSTTWPMHHKRASVVAEERVIVAGTQSPEMVKAIFIASKTPGLTLLEFFARWQHVHGPLGARVPGVRRYLQYHAVPESYAAGMNTHDGWSELWFDDVSSLRAAVASPEWRALEEDGATLFGLPMGVGVARERVQKDAGWTYRDWGVGQMTEDDVRALLTEQGYASLAADPGAPEQIRRAAAGETLAVWTDEHLVTFDESRIDARPEGR